MATYAAAFGTWALGKSPSKRIVVGRDSRVSGPLFHRVVVSALREAVSLAAAGVLDLEALVTHRFALDDLDAAFAAASRRGPGFVKAVVCP